MKFKMVFATKQMSVKPLSTNLFPYFSSKFELSLVSAIHKSEEWALLIWGSEKQLIVIFLACVEGTGVLLG